MNNRLITVMVLFLTLHLSAQDKWSLKQCIEYGLVHNGNNTIYANEKLSADARAKEALADYLPKISLTSTLDNNLKVQQSIIPAGVFGDKPVKVAFTQKYNANATAQLDQTIYDQSLLIGLKANKYNKQQAELNSIQSQESIIYNICTAYFQISVYQQQLELLKLNRETYSKQIELFGLQVSKGVTLQKDLDKVTVDFNNNSSQIRVAESNLQLSENELKFEMGYPILQTIAVEIVSKERIPSVLLEEPSVDFNVVARTDYKISETNIKLLDIEKDRIRAAGLPKLTAYARYGAVGFGEVLKDTYGEILDFSAVGLKLSIPILDFYKRNAQYSQAKFNRINAEEKLKLDQGRYTVDYQNARARVIEAQVNTENDQRNVALADSVLRTTDLQFQKGVTDLNDWLNSQNALKEAQNSYVKSLYNFYLAKIDLEKAGGTLKTFYNSL